MIDETIFEKSSQQSCSGLCCTKIENFGVTLGNTVILSNVNLHIHCGELTAIIGPNGAGKSTLVKALLGQVPHSGTINFVSPHGTSTGIPIIGYVPQSLNLDSNSPTSVTDLFLACRSRFPAWLIHSKKEVVRIRERLALVNADHLMPKRIGALSGGELQRVLLALALDPIPEILLMDEPASGFDQNGLELFYETVANLRKNYDLTVILVSHDLEMVRKHADRVVLLNRTILEAGPPDKVFESDSFRDIFSLLLREPGDRKDGGEL